MRYLEPEIDWVETSATVLTSSFIAAPVFEDGVNDGRDHSEYRIVFGYRVSGKQHQGYFFRREPLPEGSTLPLRYNPSAPEENNLSLFPEKPARSISKLIAAFGLAVLIIFLCEHFLLHSH